MSQSSDEIIRYHHIFTGVQDAAVLAVQVNQLRQRQPVYWLCVVIGGVVVPDIPVIRTGSQHRLGFAERNNAHLFGFIAALITCGISFFRHAAFFIPQRDFGLFS